MQLNPYLKKIVTEWREKKILFFFFFPYIIKLD